MKKLLGKLSCVAALLAILACAAPASAAVPLDEAFVISDYSVTIDVSEHNVYDITEVLSVSFSAPRHGITRNIPFRGTLYRQDREDSKYLASVTDIIVEGWKYSVSRSGDYVLIQIGDANETVSGDQAFTIHYRMNYGSSGGPDFDEVYHNIIGPEWDTTIERVQFSVTMPKDFAPAKPGFSMGGYGVSGYDPEALKLNVDGTTVSGYTTKPLQNYEGITMRLELPKGYFKTADPRMPDYILMAVIGLLALGSVLLFLLYGRDDKPVKTVEFYAPEGMTPSEVGYVVDGAVDNRDACSLILYWADKGYLTIEDMGGKEFRLSKVKDLGPEAKAFERHMFGKLFSGRETVTTDDLKYTFYNTVDNTKSMVRDSFEKKDRRVFTKVSKALMPLLSFVTALPVMLTLALNIWRDTFDFKQTAIFTAVAGLLILLPVFFLTVTMRRWRGEKPGTRVIKAGSFLLLALLTLGGFLVYTLKSLTPELPWIAAMATLLIGLTSVFIIKRTPKGVEWLGKIMGFRDFIVLAERDKLVALVEQNPSYFYNVLPYAWVLNVTDRWAKKFEAIAIEPPQWYYGYSGGFHPIIFVSSLNYSMNAFQAQMTSTPPSKGGGGFGGGGFSGGGFSGGGGGGGGGGSW